MSLTNFMILCTNRKHRNIENMQQKLTIDSVNIQNVDVQNILGVNVDNALNSNIKGLLEHKFFNCASKMYLKLSD